MLMKERQKQLMLGWFTFDDEMMFGWSKNERSYYVKGAEYWSFWSDYWIDYMVKHGGYSESDNFS